MTLRQIEIAGKGKPATEKQIQSAVMAHWKAFALPNTFVGAIPNAGALGQPGLTKGIFDLLVMSPKIGAGFLELKTEKGATTEHQESFRLACIRAGVKCAVAYGRDEPIVVLREWGVVR